MKSKRASTALYCAVLVLHGAADVFPQCCASMTAILHPDCRATSRTLPVQSSSGRDVATSGRDWVEHGKMVPEQTNDQNARAQSCRRSSQENKGVRVQEAPFKIECGVDYGVCV